MTRLGYWEKCYLPLVDKILDFTKYSGVIRSKNIMGKSVGGILIEGPWSSKEILDYLNATRAPMRLAVNRKSGYPMVIPIWHLWSDGALWSAIRPNSALARALKGDGRCSFDISINSPPYKGVRGRGIAILEANGQEILEKLVAKFTADSALKFREMLLRQSHDELAVRLIPERLTAWDFTNRMSD